MKKLHLIGNAHLDPVWQWRWQEGYAEVLATFRSALDRMNDFPDFKFTSACSVYYKWVEQTDPEMFAEIQERVKEGRWNIVGGWLLQPDCNLPCGESFARHGLIAQRYFKEKFGITAKTGYNIDSFGHNLNLPKILKNSGMDNYVFMRPSPSEKPEIEKSLFIWQADDGSRVNAFRVPNPYNLRIDKKFENIYKTEKQAETENSDLMLFYGVGNHGGGPTVRLINAINAAGLKNAVYSTPDEYFDEVDKSDLPVVCDELQHHARGCYSAKAAVKKSNRMAENALLAAERFAVMGNKLLGLEYPAEELKRAWENVLFNQFHDILGGCSIREAYDDAAYLYGETMAITDRIINKTVQAIGWNIDTLQGETLPGEMIGSNITWVHEVLGTPIMIFNPHEFPVRAVVKVFEPRAAKVTDANGKEIPMQRVHKESNKLDCGNYDIAFVAEVPPMGYSVYRLFLEQKSELKNERIMEIGRTSMENDKISVEFDERTGDICRIYDKESKKTVADRPCRAILLDESTCDTWAHDRVSLGEEVSDFKNADFLIMEDGEVQVTLRTTAYSGDNVLRRDFTLIPGSREISVKAKVDMRTPLRSLKITFPVSSENITAQIPYGTITRKGETGEEICGNFIASENIAVANNGQYAYDYYKGELRLTILRTAAYLDHSKVRDIYSTYMDLGETEFEYSLFPFESITDAERTAAKLNSPLVVLKGTFHNGSLPEKMCGIEITGSASVTAIKKGEDGGTVVRMCELEGKEGEASVKLFGEEFKGFMKPHEIKTINDRGEQLDLIEWKKEATV